MRRAELAQALAQNRIPPSVYSLSGGLPDEAYCLDHAQGMWHVYYSERGLRSGLQSFETEEEACDYFFRLVMHDLSVQPDSGA
jgi:hypothetical protein